MIATVVTTSWQQASPSGTTTSVLQACRGIRRRLNIQTMSTMLRIMVGATLLVTEVVGGDDSSSDGIWDRGVHSRDNSPRGSNTDTTT